jgi:hypothetical protein
MKKKAKRWLAQIDAWQRSGMTQAAFCRARGLSVKSFGYWRRKQVQAEAPSQALVPIMVDAAIPALAEMDLPGGLRLRVPVSADAARVGALVRSLLAC